MSRFVRTWLVIALVSLVAVTMTGGASATAPRWPQGCFADLRGTGASFGTLTAELGGQMIADVGSLADWIAARPWSNGRVGVIGVSYSGDTAMLSLALRNHHITAAEPISYDFDPFEDLVCPRAAHFPQ